MENMLKGRHNAIKKLFKQFSMGNNSIGKSRHPSAATALERNANSPRYSKAAALENTVSRESTGTQQRRYQMSEDAVTVICGNYGKDPELKYGKESGKPHMLMPIAVSSGKEGSKTNWIDVKFFEEQAAQMAELPKGTRVIVKGHLRQDVYQDKTDTTQYRTVLYAEEAGLSLRWSPRSSNTA